MADLVPGGAGSFDGLPGWELVSVGLADLAAGRGSKEAYLVAMAAERLARRGLAIDGPLPDDPEERLYRLIEVEVGEARAHGRYNALRRRLASFLRASADASAG